jgi:hypothetical protein
MRYMSGTKFWQTLAKHQHEATPHTVQHEKGNPLSAGQAKASKPTCFEQVMPRAGVKSTRSGMHAITSARGYMQWLNASFWVLVTSRVPTHILTPLVCQAALCVLAQVSSLPHMHKLKNDLLMGGQCTALGSCKRRQIPNQTIKNVSATTQLDVHTKPTCSGSTECHHHHLRPTQPTCHIFVLVHSLQLMRMCWVIIVLPAATQGHTHARLSTTLRCLHATPSQEMSGDGTQAAAMQGQASRRPHPFAVLLSRCT